MSLLAEERGTPQGCIAVFRLRPGWFELRHLVVRDATRQAEMAAKLLAGALGHAELKQATYLKATTLAAQPYVDVYKNSGFRPVRRTLRIAWDLSNSSPPLAASIAPSLLPADKWKEGLEVFIEGLRPYWDWWIDEAGGPAGVAALFDELTEQDCWMCTVDHGRMVGVAFFTRDFYGPGEAFFGGVYVAPDARRHRIGSALMSESLKMARQLGQRKLVVYTVSGLDHLLPGTLLYLQSGGRIEAEYLQLQQF
jgi:GNAT superfamily N-acetyltransferase